MESGHRYEFGQTIPAHIRWEDFSGRGLITIVSERAFRWEIGGGLWRKGVSGDAVCGQLLEIRADGVMTFNLGHSLLTVQTEDGFVQAFRQAKADFDAEYAEEEESKREFVPSDFFEIGDQPTAEQIFLFQLVNQIEEADHYLDFRVGSFVSLAESGCSYCDEMKSTEQLDRQSSSVMLFRSLDDEYDLDGRRCEIDETTDEIEGVCLAHVVELLTELSPLLYEEAVTWHLGTVTFDEFWGLAQEPDDDEQTLSEIRVRLAAAA